MNVYSPITPHPPLQSNSRPMSMQLGATFATHEDMLSYLTQNWRINFVTSDLENLHVLEEFAIRPFLMVVYVDAPVLRRFERSKLFATLIAIRF
jgi:dCMP deaminase